MPLGTPTVGSWAAGGSGSLTPAYPSGTQNGDLLLLICGLKGQTYNGGSTAVTPSGWTKLGDTVDKGGYTSQSADTGTTTLFVAAKDTVTSSDASPATLTVDGTDNNAWWAVIVRIPKGGSLAGLYAYFDGEDTSGDSTFTSGAMTRRDAEPEAAWRSGDRAIWAGCIPTDAASGAEFSSPSLTATGATFSSTTELAEPYTASLNDVAGVVGYSICDTIPSSGTVTLSMTAANTTNIRGPLVVVRVREYAPDGGALFWAFP